MAPTLDRDKIDLRLPWQRAFDDAKERGYKGDEDLALSMFIAGERYALAMASLRLTKLISGHRID